MMALHSPSTDAAREGTRTRRHCLTRRFPVAAAPDDLRTAAYYKTVKFSRMRRRKRRSVGELPRVAPAQCSCRNLANAVSRLGGIVSQFVPWGTGHARHILAHLPTPFSFHRKHQRWSDERGHPDSLVRSRLIQRDTTRFSQPEGDLLGLHAKNTTSA